MDDKLQEEAGGWHVAT